MAPSQVSNVREQGSSVSASDDLALEFNTITSISGHTDQSRFSVGGNMQRHKYQKAKIIGGQFEDWLPHFLFKDPDLGSVRGDPGHPGPGSITM